MAESNNNIPVMPGKTASLLDLGMRLHVPYNNDFGLIEKLIPYAPYIRSIYLPCNHTVLGSGRFEGRAINRKWENYDAEVADIAELVAPHDIKVNMLLNSLHVPSDVLNNFQGSILYRYLKGYEGSRIEWLTVANIQLAILLRRYFPGFKLDVSVLGLVDTVSRARYWYDLVHPDLFCVDLDHGKDLHLIENITKLTGVPVKVLAMDFCLPDCPYKPWHYIHNALKEESAFSCWQIRADKPWYYYKGRSIPPYYLKRYAGLTHDIKIVERNADTDTILRTVRHYAVDCESRYMLPGGGIVQEGDRPPSILESVDKLYYYFNSKHPLFKPVPENIFTRTLSCDLNCGVCTFCYEVWKEEWQVREDYELLAGYLRDVCTETASPGYYHELLDTLHGQRHNIAFIEAIKMMEEYVGELFRPVLDYFLGLAFLELKSPLADGYIDRMNVPAFKSHLREIQRACSDQTVISYTDFDRHDTMSFIYLQRLESVSGSDNSARYHLIESYLRMREEQVVKDLLKTVELDEQLLERLCLAAFDFCCYGIVILLTEHLDTVVCSSERLRNRLLVIRPFSLLMKGMPEEEGASRVFGTSGSYGQKENFAHLYLNGVHNGIRPNRKEQEALAAYAVSLKTRKSRLLAKMVFDFYLTLSPEHVTILKKYHQLLLEMNKRAEADAARSTIDRLYHESRDELDRIEKIPHKGSRYAALSRYYYNLNDFENAASSASQLVDIDPTASVIWDLLLKSLKNIGDVTRYNEYCRLRAESGVDQRQLLTAKAALTRESDITNIPAANKSQFVTVDAPPLVRKSETDGFRVHPVSKRMLELIDKLGGSFCIERSFKFTHKRLLCNRFIVTVPLQEPRVSQNQALGAICRELAMPAAFYNNFVKQLPAAKKVHFGFEENGNDSVLKVYLEFPYDHEQHMQSAAASDSWLLLLGFKWDPYDPSSRHVISRYSGLPSYTSRQVYDTVATRYPHASDSIIMPLVKVILKMYDNSAPNMPLWYLDVTEEGTPRHSFDIKTYRARLQISHIIPILQDVCRHYAIPPRQYENYFNTIKGHKFGHLSCGTGRDGEEFVAFYHEVHGQSSKGY